MKKILGAVFGLLATVALGAVSITSPILKPAGLSGQLQYNNSGVFGGAAALNYNNTSPFLSVGFSGSPQINLNPSASGTSSPMFYTSTYWGFNGDGSGQFASNTFNWDSVGNLNAVSLTMTGNLETTGAVDAAGPVTADSNNVSLGTTSSFDGGTFYTNGAGDVTLNYLYANGAGSFTGDVSTAGTLFASGSVNVDNAVISTSAQIGVGGITVAGTTSLDAAEITTDGVGGMYFQSIHNNGDFENQGNVTFDYMSTPGVVHNDNTGLLTSSKVALAADVSGTLPIANGGTGQTTAANAINALLPSQTSNSGKFLTTNGTAASWGTALANPMTTLGDVIYENATPAAARLAGNTTSTKQYLSQTGTGSVSAAPAWATLAASDIGSGTLAVARGGTNLASGTSGGVLAYTATGTLASSGALTANAIVLGGGAGAVPTVLGSLGTTSTVLHGNAAGAPTFGAVALSTDVSGTLQAAQFPSLTGDITTAGGALATTLATVNSNVGSFGSSTSIPSITVNGKGLVTAASGNAVVAPAGTLTGATLASGVTASSLTSVSTIATGVWNGTSIAIANGGTGQGTKAAAFDALQPMTTGGDIIYGGASGTGTRLANGGAGQVLTSGGGTAAPSWGKPLVIQPTLQKFTSGSGTYNLDYDFIITSGNATVGATYTNNAVTFTVYATVASSTQVVMSGSGAPASSGTLTKASGTGDATLTFSQVYTPTRLEITVVGGGGGGGGAVAGVATAAAGGGGGGGGTAIGVILSPSATYSYGVGAAGAAGTSGNNAGGAGGNSTFSTYTANGGAGGGGSSASAGPIVISGGGAGGTATGGDINVQGGNGGYGETLSLTSAASGIGGGSVYGHNSAPILNSNSAGNSGQIYGGGGSGGEQVNNGGSFAGGAGALGLVFVREYYQ